MTTQALTETTWVKVLERIVGSAPDEMTRHLAQILLDIIEAPADIGEILDTYGAGLLGPLE